MKMFNSPKKNEKKSDDFDLLSLWFLRFLELIAKLFAFQNF